MSRIPLHDVLAQNNSIRKELDAALFQVLDSGNFIKGKQVSQFESAFSDYIGTTNCIGVGNATDGFEIAFQALGLQSDSEIIIPSNAHVSPALAALKVGLKPVFSDVHPQRMLLTADSIREQITEKTKVVVAVHLYGRVCAMDEIMQLCEEKNLILIEDFSQAHGAYFKERKVGSFGALSVCSFYPTKPLGALGDGAAILTSDKKRAEICRTLANYGWNERDNSVLAGGNSRLDEMQAAVLNVKLNFLDKWNESRIHFAKQMLQELNSIPEISVSPFQEGDVCHLFVVQTEKRDELQKYLLENGVDCQVHFPISIHTQELFQIENELSFSEKLSECVLSIPVNMMTLEFLRVFKWN